MAGQRGTRAEVAEKWRRRLGRWRRAQCSVAEFCLRERISQSRTTGSDGNARRRVPHRAALDCQRNPPDDYTRMGPHPCSLWTAVGFLCRPISCYSVGFARGRIGGGIGAEDSFRTASRSCSNSLFINSSCVWDCDIRNRIPIRHAKQMIPTPTVAGVR